VDLVELSGTGVGGTGVRLGTNVLELHYYQSVPFEEFQEFLWHSIYFQSSGSSIQLQITMSDEQMLDLDIARSALFIEGFVLHTEAISYLGGG